MASRSRSRRRRSSPCNPTPPGTPSDAGRVTDEEDFVPVVSGTLKLLFFSGKEYTCGFDEMSSVGFARARAASHQTKASQTIELIAGQRTLTVDYEKLYQISDEKFDLSLTVVVLSEEEKPSENVVT